MSKEAALTFQQAILSNHNIRIKLIGDSITHGVGGTGFGPSDEHLVAHHTRNLNGYCWAKRFKEYAESKFDCEVVNNAISGAGIEFTLEYFDTLVDKEDDLIICTLGTNNRHQYVTEGLKRTRDAQLQLVYQRIITLYERMKAAGKTVIYVANIPSSEEDEKDGEDYWRIIHMKDIRDLYVKAAKDYNFPLIDLYTPFVEYCEKNDITVDSLLADGLHPNDTGYDVIYNILIRELGICVQ